MKKNILLVLTIVLAVSFSACNKEKINKVNPDNLVLNLNKAELQERITPLNFKVDFANLKSGPTTTSPELWAVAQIAAGTIQIIEYNWTYTYPNPMLFSDGSVNPLQGTTVTQTNQDPKAPVAEDGTNYTLASQSTIGTFPLSVTGAGALGGKAYFSSHIRGGEYGGEIFIVDYDYNDLDGTEIAALGTITDNSADYNDLTIDAVDGDLWLAGDNRQRGAIVRYAALTDLTVAVSASSSNAAYAPVPLYVFGTPLLGPSGNSVSIHGDQLWFVAGGQSYGGLLVMNKDVETLYTRTDKTNAKHFDMAEDIDGSGYFGAFLWGDDNFTNDNANLRIFNTSNGPFSYTDYTVAADVTPYGKNAIDVDFNSSNSFVFLAMGEDGVFRIDDAGVQTHSFNAMPPTYGGEDGLANGLVVHGDYVYVAWGAHGLVVLDKADLSFVGQWNGIGSCNYVAVDTSHADTNTAIMWVGNGTGGMVLLKFVDDVNP
jgi:hypothetical protein